MTRTGVDEIAENKPLLAPETAQPLRDRSPYARLQEEIQQAPALRQGLIRQLEQDFAGFSIITYFTSFNDRRGEIVDDDVEMLEELLAARPTQKPVLLILNSAGGQALAAERAVNVCRAHSRNRFEVLVPHMAKSAATMICFGADRIHMSATSELGPVDPQIPITDDQGNWMF